jgi:phosphinothricin acetyltransferase
MTIRLATEEDAAAIHAVYAPLVAETAISFSLAPPTLAQVRTRIRDTLPTWPWLVCVQGAALVGWAHAGPDRANRHHPPTAYDWSVEVSVYVDRHSRRSGVARALYETLFDVLRRQQFVNALAVITLPNPAATALHESLGFRRVGLLSEEGFKLGKWYDVSWWQLRLRNLPDVPELPIPLESFRRSGNLDDLLRHGSARLPA